MKRILFVALFLMFSLSLHAKTTHVIYITMDGVRWQDIYQNKKAFPKLWKHYSKVAHFYGQPGSSDRVETASTPISLPSYFSQSSGKVLDCMDNDCSRIRHETLFEAIRKTKSLDKKDVAVISSWQPIDFAAEQTPGSIVSNHAQTKMVDPETGLADSTMAIINKLQEEPTPYEGYRYDRYTYQHALHYLKKHHPKLMWIGLFDADTEAHFDRKENYYQALSFYDDLIDDLISQLKLMGAYHNTAIIITTDHGRGNDKNWVTHGPEFPESKRTWMITFNTELIPDKVDNHGRSFSTTSIRKTIEQAMYS